MQYRVYVDEAGDRGISSTSSRHFVVSAIVVADSSDAQLRLELGELRASLGRRKEHTLHFVNFTHSERLKAAQDVADSSVEAIANVVIDKKLLADGGPIGDADHISRPDPMYLWALRLLLERISWLVDGHGSDSAIVTFSHIKRFRADKLHSYRQSLETSNDVNIRWRALHRHPFRIATPNEVELLQVADTAASALFKAIEPDRFGNTEPRYLEELASKIFRQNGGNITSYGLKTFPPAASRPGGPLAFLRYF